METEVKSARAPSEIAHARDPKSKLNRAARWLLTIGLVGSLGAIFLFK